MKITMYELLGMIKDGKVPLKFKVNDEIYEYDEDRGYICRHIGGWAYLYENLNKGYISLNDEVEILEEPIISKLYINNELQYDLEEKKIPEKLTDILRVDDLIPPVDENMYKIWTQTIKNQNKINEIIDCLDYLKSKGE